MVNLIRFIFGYVKIVIIGENPEIFINHLISSNVSVWNIERKGDLFVLCISVSDYKKIRKIRSDISLKYRTKIIQKYGLKFRLINSKIRAGICVGILLILMLNLFFSNFIWQIEVTGIEQISQDEVINVCKEFGLVEGLFKKNIDTYDLSHKIALKLDKIAWLSLNIEGSKLTVNISENKDSAKEDSVPTSIIAIRDGTIHSIVEKRGTQNVEIGQTVRKGEVLISCVESVGNYVRYVSASGDVIADTHHTFYIEVDKKYKYKIKNYIFESKKAFEFFGLRIPLYLTGTDEFDESFTEEKQLKMFNKELPIAMKIRYFVFSDVIEKEISKDYAVNIALSEFVQELKNNKIISVFEKKIDVKEDKNKYYVTINAQCRENIGEKTVVDVMNY